jgi:hypothetical protein
MSLRTWNTSLERNTHIGHTISLSGLILQYHDTNDDDDDDSSASSSSSSSSTFSSSNDSMSSGGDLLLPVADHLLQDAQKI